MALLAKLPKALFAGCAINPFFNKLLATPNSRLSRSHRKTPRLCRYLTERAGPEIDCHRVIWSLRHSAIALRMEFDRHYLRTHYDAQITIIRVVIALQGVGMSSIL